MNKLRKEEIRPGYFKLFFNDKYVGDLIMDVDGYYYYQPINNSGYWSSYSLKLIIDYLDKMNKEHDNKIVKFFKKRR